MGPDGGARWVSGYRALLLSSLADLYIRSLLFGSVDLCIRSLSFGSADLYIRSLSFGSAYLSIRSLSFAVFLVHAHSLADLCDRSLSFAASRRPWCFIFKKSGLSELQLCTLQDLSVRTYIRTDKPGRTYLNLRAISSFKVREKQETSRPRASRNIGRLAEFLLDSEIPIIELNCIAHRTSERYNFQIWITSGISYFDFR
jgi:hypothetical protein